MTVSQLIKEIRVLLKRWFHKRNIIIVSEKQVKHIPVSVGLQLAALSVVTSFVCWASYSTGSYVAAHHALKEQGQALRTVANAHVNSSFNPLAKTQTLAVKPHEEEVKPYTPKFTISALEKEQMESKVAYLESKVNQLQNANAVIIQRVQEKTAGKIDDLENIIRQTGLDSDAVRRQVDKNSKAKALGKSQGGPYIPADMTELRQSADELFSNLDELDRLRQIVTALPLGYPLKGAQAQSQFGHRYDPFTNRLAFHSGLDLSGPLGSKVFSTADGTVVKAEHNGAYGNMIDIDHGNGITTRYAHLSAIMVKPGQKVRKGERIGVQGSTGRSTGAHLHYEIRFHDKAMDPKNFLQAGKYVSQE